MNKKLLASVLIILWALSSFVRLHTKYTKRLQENLASSIIRFHVIANSDSDEDQNLKYEVKDALINALCPYFENVNDIDDARAVIKDKLPLIEEVALQVIEANGYSYPVAVSFTYCYFPMKIYGDYTFPPGTYEALQVRIGDARGKNWWCVIFPPLCFVDETYSIVSENSEKKLKYLLTTEELDYIKTHRVPIKVRFKLFGFVQKLFNK